MRGGIGCWFCFRVEVEKEAGGQCWNWVGRVNGSDEGFGSGTGEGVGIGFVSEVGEGFEEENQIWKSVEIGVWVVRLSGVEEVGGGIEIELVAEFGNEAGVGCGSGVMLFEVQVGFQVAFWFCFETAVVTEFLD